MSPCLEDDPVVPLGACGLPNFVHPMLRLMRQTEELGVVADQWGSPTWASDLARALLAIVRAPMLPAGIYRFINTGKTSWHEFATEIEVLGREFGILEKPCRVKA